jgi:hypothetical protein
LKNSCEPSSCAQKLADNLIFLVSQNYQRKFHIVSSCVPKLPAKIHLVKSFIPKLLEKFGFPFYFSTLPINFLYFIVRFNPTTI